MSIDERKPNGKVWKITAIGGIPLAALITWIYFTGVVKGTVVERVSQLERRITKVESLYEETSKSIGIIQVDIGKISVKLGVE